MNATKNKARLNLEALEDRQLLAVSIVAGDLVINSGSGNDNVVVSNYTSPSGTAYYEVKENGVPKRFLRSSVRGGDVIFRGNAGNDTFQNFTSLRSKAFGGSGNDYLEGGVGNDTLVGDSGDDYILGHDGNDRLEGGAGNDVMDGGWGNDDLRGGTGSDEMFGQNGNDRLYGEAGRDWLWGGSGNDLLDGGSDIDFAWGEAGADTFKNMVDIAIGPFRSPRLGQQALFPGALDFNLFQRDRL